MGAVSALGAASPRIASRRTRCSGSTLLAFAAFSVAAAFQTRSAFARLFDAHSRPVPRFEAISTEPLPRAGFLICTEQQATYAHARAHAKARSVLSKT